MKLKRMIVAIIFIIVVSPTCLAAETMYVWSNQSSLDAIQTVADVEENNSLKLKIRDLEESSQSKKLESMKKMINGLYNIIENLKNENSSLFTINEELKNQLNLKDN